MSVEQHDAGQAGGLPRKSQTIDGEESTSTGKPSRLSTSPAPAPSTAEIEARLGEIADGALRAGDKAFAEHPSDTGIVARNAAAWRAEREVWRSTVRALLAEK